jgi:hypothetical protein
LYRLALIGLLGGCATADVVEHGFSFNARWDSPNVEILDFRYGRSTYLATMGRAPTNEDRPSKQGTGIYGVIPRPDKLFVQWRLKDSGAVHEDTVDLKQRLPADIKAHEVYFIVMGPQLCVYLVSPNLRARGAPASPLRKYDLRVVNIIYPDAPAKAVCDQSNK